MISVSSNRSFTEWEDLFINFTDQEFNKMGGELLDYVADNDLLNLDQGKLKDVATCLLAFAKYALEAAHFQRDLPEYKRIAMEGMANAYQSAGMAFQKTIFAGSKTKQYGDAWSSLLEYCEKYGYRSEVYAELCHIKEYKFFRCQ